MVQRDNQEFTAVIFHLLCDAMLLRDLRLGHEAFHAVTPERDDDFGIDDLELAHEVRPKDSLLFWKRIAVVRWTVFDDVSDINVSADQPSRLKHLIQETPTRTDER